MTAPRRALIVIDVQNEYFTGGLQVEYPDPALSLANIGRAMDAAREAGIPVIVVQHTAPPAAPIFRKGTHGWELEASIAARPHDHYVEKNWPSAYVGTDLGEWLARHEIDTLTVVGYMTQNCVDSTIKQAMHAGLTVEFLYDATGAVPYANEAGSVSAETIHRTLAVIYQSNFAAVLDTDQWLEVIAGKAVAVKDNVPASYARARAQVTEN
ncbi:cysteine hydrolase family protein [Uliginosibacterium sp. sgz301328]|uniref:cysteine hydrolase family protein n=1 Tax=Uliginosibacterium sp. sgz301328 TaxID=3243764 RepID=UPI00359D139E